jgi:hypothetical protein
MTKERFALSFAAVLAHEGCNTDDRRAPGKGTGSKVGKGVLKGTNMGIAASSFPDLDTFNHEHAAVSRIARATRPPMQSPSNLRCVRTFGASGDSGYIEETAACPAAETNPTVNKITVIPRRGHRR